MVKNNNWSTVKIFSIILLLTSVLIVPYQGFADVDKEKSNGRYIIVLKNDPSIDPQIEANKTKSQGAQILDVYSHALKGFSISLPNENALEAIKKNPSISYVEQDQIVQVFSQTLPTGINRIDGDLSTTSSGDGSGNVDVDIAIIDTGIDSTHPDLNVWNMVNFVFYSFTANDENGHGTHVAGIAAAYDNNQGIVGVAPGARLWSVKVLDSNGSGFLSGILSGIDYVTAHASEIEVANMSLGMEGSTSAGDDAINNSVAAGVTYVVAAGNSAKDASLFWPASNPNVITVSAIADGDGKCGGTGFSTNYGADDTFATFSNYGRAVDIAAPGVNIWSTYLYGGFNTLSGTSMASPHVSGAAALYKSTHPGSSPSDVKNAIISSGVPQITQCDTLQNNGYGGFTGDPDNYHEPLVYVGNISPPSPIHDVAISSVSVPSSVTKNQHINISVQVANQGNQPENMVVTVNDLTDNVEIGSQNLNLGSGLISNLNFDWYTSSSSLGSHTIEATASVVNGETDTSDNSKITNVMVTENAQTPTMSVADITMGGTVSQKGKNTFCRGTSSILILDETNQSLSDVLVTGEWSGATSGTVSGTTSTNGKIEFTSNQVKSCGTFVFTVTDVSKSGFEYNSNDNLTTSESITLP